MKLSIYRDGLTPYLPEGTSEIIAEWLYELGVRVVLWDHRKTKLGDYRANSKTGVKSISINKSLNKYAFLITIVHEIAHGFVHLKYHKNVLPHGEEWKQEYKKRLLPFLTKRIFPSDLEPLIAGHLLNPKASASAEVGLEKALRVYNEQPADIYYVDELKPGEKFVLRDGKVFIKGDKRRTRFRCIAINSAKMYLISGLAEVKKLEKNEIEEKIAYNFLKHIENEKNQPEKLRVKDLKPGDKFILQNGMRFKIMKKLKTKFVCSDVKTGIDYLVPGKTEIVKIY